MQTIWGDPDRFVAQYYQKYCKNRESKDWHDWPYFAADGAVLPLDGYYRIRGRVPIVYVSLKPGISDGTRVTGEIITALETMIGKIARPRAVNIVPDLPKTRSGKIMRRVLAAISNSMDTGDVTTLANPDVVDLIRKQVQGEGPVVVQEGPEDLKQFGANE